MRPRRRSARACCLSVVSSACRLQAVDDLAPQADARVQPRQRLVRPEHLGVLVGRRRFAVAPLLLGDLEQQPFQRVDRLVGALQALLVQRRQLAQPLAALGPRAAAPRVGALVRFSSTLARSSQRSLLAADLLDARQRDLVVGLEAQDLVVQLLGLVRLPEALAQARGVVVQRHGRVDRAELVDGAEIDA